MAGRTSHAVRRHRRNRLSQRVTIRRAFGGMLTCMSLLLLGFGGYLIEQQFADPLGSSAAGLFGAAMMIATALILLSYVIHPGARQYSKVVASQILEMPGAQPGPTIEIALRRDIETQGMREDLPVQSRYTDHTRIRC